MIDLSHHAINLMIHKYIRNNLTRKTTIILYRKKFLL